MGRPTIIVTGSAGGIGRAIADSFPGCIEIDKHNCDLSNDSETRRFALKIRGPVKALINCAGGSLQSAYGDLDAWDKTFAVNVRAVFHLCSILRHEITEGGSIINITSMNAEVATPFNPAYIASKGALKMLTKAMALDWAQYGIRVNNVCPGYIHTNMTHQSWSDPEKSKVRTERTMLKRWGEPKDLIGICHFLVSDESSYITGADFVVDGGWLAKGI